MKLPLLVSKISNIIYIFFICAYQSNYAWKWVFCVFIISVGQLSFEHIWFGLFLFPPFLPTSELERPVGKIATFWIQAESESLT